MVQWCQKQVGKSAPTTQKTGLEQLESEIRLLRK